MGLITMSEHYVAREEPVRLARESRISTVASGRGQPVTVLANPTLLRPRQRTRTLLPEFAAIRARELGHDRGADGDAARCRPEP
jgi:hypothetical protein